MKVIINIYGGNNLILPDVRELPPSVHGTHHIPLEEAPADESAPTVTYNIYGGQHLITPQAICTPSAI